MSNYQLKDEVKDEYVPIVAEFIAKIEEAYGKIKAEAEARAASSKKRSHSDDEDDEGNRSDEDEDDDSGDEVNNANQEFNLDLTNTKLNPYTLWKLLESLGYRKIEMDHNGWEFDFWITFEKADRQALLVSGTGITFTLNLSNKQQ